MSEGKDGHLDWPATGVILTSLFGPLALFAVEADAALWGEGLLTLCYLASIVGENKKASGDLFEGFGFTLLGNGCAVVAGFVLGVSSMVAFSSLWALATTRGLLRCWPKENGE